MPGTIDSFIRQLAERPSTEGLFNPYHGMDRRATICRANLRRYLTQMQGFEPRLMLVGEAYGYRGGRLTGVPFTSERILLRGVEPFGLFGDGYRSTSGVEGGVAESSATIVWEAVAAHAPEPPLLWNCLPFHPHPPERPDANRAPTVAEGRLGAPFLDAVRASFDVRLILSVGRKAQAALDELGWAHVPVRHPSHGGKREFVLGLCGGLRRLSDSS